MADPKDFAEIVKQAEQAVKGVADPELRRVAFDKILNALLEGSTLQTGSRKRTSSTITSTSTGKVKPKKVHGPKGHIRELADEGFFGKPKSIAQVKAELENRGHHIPITSLSAPLQSLCQEKILRRQRTKVKAKSGKDKETFMYSEW
jgi:hypothetical protein